MPFRPDTFALTALLALLTSVAPLSTDMYLPSLPSLTAELGATTAQGQLTLSAFLAGFAVGQIVHGPVADRHGRKRVILAGLAVFAVASLLCALATSIETLIAARFLQAAGGSASTVLARSVVRDLYSGPRAGQELARMGVIVAVVPAIAPVLGAGLEVTFGWRANFVVTLAIAVVGIGFVAMALPETLRQRRPDPIGPVTILRGFGVLLANPAYRAYVLMSSAAYGGLFAYLSASSFVLQGVYRLSPMGFAVIFTTGVAGFMLGAHLSSRSVMARGVDATIRIGCAFLAAGGIAMPLAVAFGPGHPAEVSGPMIVYLIGIGFVMPQSMAGAMQPFPDRAGAASSLLGFTQMSFAAVAGYALGHALEAGAMPLALAVALFGVAAFAIETATRRRRAA